MQKARTNRELVCNGGRPSGREWAGGRSAVRFILASFPSGAGRGSDTALGAYFDSFVRFILASFPSGTGRGSDPALGAYFDSFVIRRLCTARERRRVQEPYWGMRRNHAMLNARTNLWPEQLRRHGDAGERK